MNKTINSLLLFFTLTLFGCSTTTKTVFKSEEPNLLVEIYNIESDKYDYLGKGSANYTLNNNYDYYLIRSTQERKQTATKPITRTRFNSKKLIALAIPLIADIFLVSNFASTKGTGSTLTGPAFFVGTLGWAGLAFTPWRLYEKTYQLPKLDPLPYKRSDENYINVKRVGINMSGGNYVEKYYDDYNEFINNDPSYKRIEKESINFETTNLDSQLNGFLTELNYSDSIKKMFVKFSDTYTLSSDIITISEHRIGKLVCSEFFTTWNLYKPHKKEAVYSKEYSAFSEWTPYKDEGGYNDAHLSALKNSMIKVLLDSVVHDYLSSDEFSVENKKANLRNLKIPKSSNYVSNLEEAVESVVTIKTKNGHGSGCIISNNGIIVTNYHVIEDSSIAMSIVLHNGVELPCEILRTNPEYDLALLKIERLNTKPFFLSSDDLATLGKEVYAIGTPTLLDLGQTISKGIISGKRLFNEKIYIQTDVSINGGNSGGALIDERGNLIGIVNAKIIGKGVEGLGFAIPSSYILESLKVSYQE